MARFFIHLRDGTGELLDPEGVEHPSLESLRNAVLRTVRDLMSSDLKNGVIDFRFRVDAEDADGSIVYSLPFKRAVDIIAEAATAG
jgi:hypothetical protein